jgi:broad specificity phosphatase PhoE
MAAIGTPISRSSLVAPSARTGNLFRDGCSGGETPQQVSARADRVVNRVRAIRGDVLVFTSGHFMRVLASRWLGLEPTANTVDILC